MGCAVTHQSSNAASASAWSYPEMRNAFGFDLEHYLYYGSYPGAADLVINRDRWTNCLGALGADERGEPLSPS